MWRQGSGYRNAVSYKGVFGVVLSCLSLSDSTRYGLIYKTSIHWCGGSVYLTEIVECRKDCSFVYCSFHIALPNDVNGGFSFALKDDLCFSMRVVSTLLAWF